MSVTTLGVALVAVAISTGVSAASDASNGPSLPDRDLTLQVRMTVASDLPPNTRAILTREAETIWRREGVHVRWLSADEDRLDAGVVLRVLVGHVLARPRDGEAWPVGQLLPDQAGDRIAIASIAGARRVLAMAGQNAEPSELTAHRLGLVLGRTVAHEIGHYLLGTGSHARRGLMRARIDAADFADLRDGSFFLDGAASRWIRTTFDNTAVIDKRRFTY